MPKDDIKGLRQSGRLEEALALANEELLVAPENIWSKRNIGWVYYDYLKQSMEPGRLNIFEGYLHKILELHLPPEEKMLYDQLSWKIGMKVFEVMKLRQPDIQACFRLLDAVQAFHFTKPSKGYSYLFKAFHKAMKDTDRYIQLCDWWDFQYFMPEDFEQDRLENGTAIMAIGEQAYIAYAKHLLPKQVCTGETIFDKDKALAFLPMLSDIVDKYPQFLYPPYFKAKLLLVTGDRANMLDSLLPFARKKHNEFWTWDVLAQAFSDDADKVLACYCKALSCQSQEIMLVKIRQKMVELLLSKQSYNEAKTEIEILVKTKHEEGHPIPSKIQHWQTEDWYMEVVSGLSNARFYQQYIPLAESLLFSDIPEENVIVEFVNTDKKIVNFIVSEKKFGSSGMIVFFKRVVVGETLKVRFKGGSNGGMHQLYTAEKVKDEPFQQQFLKDVDGKVKISEGKSFGFIEDAYIHPSIIARMQLIDGMHISGQCLKSYNQAKQQWGWKLISQC